MRRIDLEPPGPEPRPDDVPHRRAAVGQAATPVKADRRLDPARVLALQRTLGNQGVRRLLERDPVRGRALLQRNVGFELEDANWRAYVKEEAALRPARRKEPLYQVGGQFSLEGDDSAGRDKPSLEFVTVPFPTDASGLSSLTATFNSIRSIMGRIGPYHGRNGPPEVFSIETVGEAQKLVPHADYAQAKPENFVRNDIHGLGDHVWLSGGRSDATFKLQATQGVSLEDLPTIMRYFGGAPAGETTAQATQRDPARRMMHEGRIDPALDADKLAMAVLGNAPRLAELAIAELKTADAEAFRGSTAALTGFLAQAILYVKRLSLREKLAKYLVPLLARTEFSTMFLLLPPEQQAALRRDGSRLLIQAVLKGANAPAGSEPALNLTANSPVAADPRWGLGSLTIGAWVKALSREVDPIDYLNSVNILVWLAQAEPDLDEPGKTRASDALESLAVLGEHNPSKRTDAPDILGHTRMAIFENRAIEGMHGVEAAYNLTYYYLQFFSALRAARGADVKYPEGWVYDNLWFPAKQLVGKWWK